LKISRRSGFAAGSPSLLASVARAVIAISPREQQRLTAGKNGKKMHFHLIF
jgi:hypothetical protein